jgi:hypothetical protein
MFYPGQAYPGDGPGSTTATQTFGAGTTYPANFAQGAWLAGNEHANDMMILVEPNSQLMLKQKKEGKP